MELVDVCDLSSKCFKSEFDDATDVQAVKEA